MPADSDRLAHLRVEALDRVSGVEDFPQLRREGEERNHLLPVAPPALRDRGILLSPRAGVNPESWTPHGCRIGPGRGAYRRITHGPASDFQCGVQVPD